MVGIVRRTFGQPDESYPTDDGSVTNIVQVGDNMVMHSVMQPGWSWEEFVKPMAEEDSCPMDHREYILSGRIRFGWTMAPS